MYRVLLVDDERPIREGLTTLIDWESLGFEVAGTAADGVEALAFVSAQAVDLIVADIRMPRLDGLELLAELRSRGNPVRFLVLSGFADFQYAQKASSLRIDGYLLKPVDEDELARLVAEAAKQLDAGFTAARLLEGASRVPAAYAWSRWQVLLLSTGDPEALKRLQTLCDAGRGEAFALPPLVGVLLKRVYPRGNNLDALGRELTAALGDASWFAAVGEAVADPALIPTSLQQARALLADKFFQGQGVIAWQSRSVLGAPPPVESWALRLVSAVTAGRNDGVREVLRGATTALWQGADEAQAREFLSRLATAVVQSLSPSEQPLWLHEPWTQTSLQGLVDALAEGLSSMATQAEGDPVVRLTQLIETRFQDDLKLEHLAEGLGYSADHLGKLFRQRTGRTFRAALEDQRMHQAQRLLGQGLKVYQVAESVGYRYVDYFHAVFRRHTGVSPSSYRPHATRNP